MTTPTELDPTLAAMRDELDRLRAEVEGWRARFAKGEVRDLAFTNSATEVAPLYTALDLEGSAGTAFEVPGQYPFTRGIHPTGYRGKLWTMRQFAGFGVNALASHEVHVARYYMKRGAYVAAANRAQYALKTYPQAPANEEGLLIMVKAYDALGMNDLRNDAERVIRKNFPDSKYLKGERGSSSPWWQIWNW